jgi:hypothetical protein
MEVLLAAGRAAVREQPRQLTPRRDLMALELIGASRKQARAALPKHCLKCIDFSSFL